MAGAERAADAAVAAHAAATAELAALIGDETPAPYFDARTGSVAGPDRVATRGLMDAISTNPPAVSGVAAAVSAQSDWTYAAALVIELWLGASAKSEETRGWTLCCDAVGEAAAGLLADCLPPAPGDEQKQDAETARACLPFLVRAARHCARRSDASALVACFAPFGERAPLDLGDREDLWGAGVTQDDLGVPGPLPPAVSRGPSAADLMKRRARLPLGDVSSTIRRDAAAVLSTLNDGPADVDALAVLRARVPKVAPPQFDETRLRDWTPGPARALSAGLAIVLDRILDPKRPRASGDARAPGRGGNHRRLQDVLVRVAGNQTCLRASRGARVFPKHLAVIVRERARVPKTPRRRFARRSPDDEGAGSRTRCRRVSCSRTATRRVGGSWGWNVSCGRCSAASRRRSTRTRAPARRPNNHFKTRGVES